MANLPHGTVTFLFTDIQGSTRSWEQYSETMPDAYARHDAILRGAITAHGGVVYKTIGDAFQVAFPTAPAGVAAALAAQQALQREDWPTPQPILVRMALHTGAVDPDPDGDYRSPVLNRLGRLISAGHGGQCLLSLAAQELSRDELPPEATLRDLGDRRLKDLFRPERIFQLVHPALPGDFPPLRTLDARTHNLPIQPTPLIGREQAIHEARALLERDHVRLVTLTGPGGTGKTRLGLQVAAELVDVYADGVCFVPLAPLTDPELVGSTIAQMLKAPDMPEVSLMERLRMFLRDRHLLLVLDNVEHVIDAAPLVAELLASCPELKVLATSRVPLRIRAEHERAVPPLTLPDPRRLPVAAAVTQYEAVRLFIERAQAAKPDFVVTSANAPAVVEICHRLDGLPLAIELAAAWIKLLPPEALNHRLEQRLHLLTGGARDLPPHQRTMRDAIAWSHDLLSPDEQALFRRLAVFAGGCTFEAAEAVVANPEGTLDILEGLSLLADKSLMRQEEQPSGEPRFVMLETIREFGLEQLDASGEAQEARQQHADYIVTLVEQVHPIERRGGDLGPWLEHMSLEQDNLRTALEWALGHDADAALRLAGMGATFWLNHGYLHEGMTWLERALPLGDSVPPAVHAHLLRRAGNVAWNLGRYEDATRLGEASLALWREVGDTWEIADTLVELAPSVGEQGDLQRSRVLLQEARTLFQGLNDTYRVATVDANLGFMAHLRGDLQQAASIYRHVLALYRECNATEATAYCLANLADVNRDLGDTATAKRLYRESLALLSPSSNKRTYLTAAQGLALVHAMNGRVKTGARLLSSIAAFREQSGFIMEQNDLASYEETINRLGESLGEEAFAAVWEAGRSTPLELVLEQMLTGTDD